ncbi:hypothetical protein PsorP6_006697 [Peronosclerospora sorghi]|uniref:Uncharacterized protein n=1 Tax=Peronosclerospora sorghi TaxID=230839 RepID=A0ACC0W2J6_9STRA|nr:hypothetical protein PsorP6_006697 [Peronosclerospora sorghi]
MHSITGPAPKTALPSGLKRKVETAAPTLPTTHATHRTYHGKCQYKTGKCFNERTLKRNGDAHSLCEEHRIKQNLIQRRSDRKYQTVHAIRRRERSQRRAVLKKQVSMAVAQQLFYEHHQQKTLGIPVPPHHPLHVLSTTLHPELVPVPSSAPPIHVPKASSSAFFMECPSGTTSPLYLSFQLQQQQQPQDADVVHATPTKQTIASTTSSGKKDEATPTGIDDFRVHSFVDLSVPPTRTPPASLCAIKDTQGVSESRLGDPFGYMPISSCEKEAWTDDDIAFLQTILLS